MANPYIAGALLGNVYSNPTFNQTNRDITNPSLNSGKSIANRLGITYDFSEIEKIFKDAVEKGIEVNQELYDQANDKYYENIAAQSASYLDTMRKANANALATGASRGVAAANELSAMLGMAQEGAAGALDLALQGYNLGDQANADTAQAIRDALDTANQTGLQLGALDNEALMAWVQQYVAELQYQAELNALANAGGGNGFGYGSGSYGGGAGAGAATGAAENAAASTGGRFTQGFVNATTQAGELPLATALGQLFDEWDRTGKVNEVTMQTLMNSNDPALVQAMYEKYMPVAQQVANSTELIDKKAGTWKPLETPVQPGDMKTVQNPAANPVYAAGLQGLQVPGQTLNTAPTFQAPAYQTLPGGLVPPNVTTGVPAVDRAVDRLALQQAYQYATTQKGAKQYGDFMFGGKESDYINPAWDKATQDRVKTALNNAGMFKGSSALSADGNIIQNQGWNPATPVQPTGVNGLLQNTNPAAVKIPNYAAAPLPRVQQTAAPATTQPLPQIPAGPRATPATAAVDPRLPVAFETDEDKKRKRSQTQQSVQQLTQFLRNGAAAANAAPVSPLARATGAGERQTFTPYNKPTPTAGERMSNTPTRMFASQPTNNGLTNVLNTLSNAAKKPATAPASKPSRPSRPTYDSSWAIKEQISKNPIGPSQKPTAKPTISLPSYTSPSAPVQGPSKKPSGTGPIKKPNANTGNWKVDKLKNKI